MPYGFCPAMQHDDNWYKLPIRILLYLRKNKLTPNTDIKAPTTLRQVNF